MCARDAEDGEHRVAHELLQETLVALDLLRQPVEGASDHRLDDLRILALGQGGRADEISEQRRRILPFSAALLGLGERLAAVQAEARAFRVLFATSKTRSHHGKRKRVAPG